MSTRYRNRQEYHSGKMVDWLDDFIHDQAAKTANLDEVKAGRIENILDIVNKNKKISVDQKVQQYRELVGLDMVDGIEKAGHDDSQAKEAAPKKSLASRMVLSLRDKTAAVEEIMDRIKQFINQTIKNRSGFIATPAIIEQLEVYMKVNKEWLLEHFDQIQEVINAARNANKPEIDQIDIEQMTKPDTMPKDEQEPSPFANISKV